MESRLALLLRLSASIAREHDLRTILAELTNITKLLLDADRCSIYLHDKGSATLWTIVAHGVQEIRIPDTQGIAGEVFQSREVLTIADAYEDPRFDRSIDRQTGYRSRAMLAMPLVSMNETALGVFQVINKTDGGSFNEQDIHLLQHVGLYAASTLEGALLNVQLKQAHEDVVYKLSSVTRFKDPETQNHIVRVGLYCAELARRQGWTQEDISLIQLAAPMHDIGKVGIPDQILQKPGSLDPDEWQIMQKHTLYGAQILEGGESRLLEMARALALDHHERWNGSGYPHGKQKCETSIFGRMTALADVFDALTSRRHYKDPWPADRVAEFIANGRESEFDPELVDLFLGCFDEMTAIKRNYHDEDSDQTTDRLSPNDPLSFQE